MARKTIDKSGEKRSEKTTISLTPRQMEEMKLYCDASGKSVNDYIVGLIDADLKKNQAVIQDMRDFRNKRFGSAEEKPARKSKKAVAQKQPVVGDTDEGNG